MDETAIEQWIIASLVTLKEGQRATVGQPDRIDPFVIGETLSTAYVVQIAGQPGVSSVDTVGQVACLLAQCLGCHTVTMCHEGFVREIPERGEEFMRRFTETMRTSELEDELAEDVGSPVSRALLVQRGSVDGGMRMITVPYGVADDGRFVVRRPPNLIEDEGGAMWGAVGFNMVFDGSIPGAVWVGPLELEAYAYMLLEQSGHTVLAMAMPA